MESAILGGVILIAAFRSWASCSATHDELAAAGMGQSRECYPRNIMTEDGGVTRDEWDDIRTALLEMAALLRENVRSLGGITEELERLRLEMGEFRAVAQPTSSGRSVRLRARAPPWSYPDATRRRRACIWRRSRKPWPREPGTPPGRHQGV